MGMTPTDSFHDVPHQRRGDSRRRVEPIREQNLVILLQDRPHGIISFSEQSWPIALVLKSLAEDDDNAI
jgi:hypothetical protein